MRIQCPNCETSYQLADGALGSVGRKVRCARCGTVWHASPAEIEAMRGIKRVLDPDGILNPGKLFD